MPPHSSKGPANDIPSQYPPPLVSETSPHSQTIIILHGHDSTAEIFAPPLLETTTESGNTLQTAFPEAKLIFLNASRTGAVVSYKKSLTHTWFCFDSTEWHKGQGLIAKNLKKSCEYVHWVLEKEIELVGRENVVLWGLGQGCAATLSTMLTWDGGAFAGVVGMCGYLPFSNHIEDILERDDDDKTDPAEQAIELFRREIDMEDKSGMSFRQIPVFLGHGVKDVKIPIQIAREAGMCLELIKGAHIKMFEYKELGHCYSPEMLSDILDFIREKLEKSKGEV